MKTILHALAASVLLVSAASAADLVNVSGASNIAINGYDAVGFFTESKPVHGNPEITSTYQGATYLFASKDHKKLFDAEPAKYAPQCGGYCAFGVSVGALFPVDINTWKVDNGKLYFNLNPEIAKLFDKDLKGNVAKAEKNWPGIVKKHAK